MSTEKKKDWFLFSIIALGSLSIGIGLISLVASNWNYIPNSIKLVIGFMICLASLYGIYKAKQLDKTKLFEGFIFFFNIFCLAYMGLLGQIYQDSQGLGYFLLQWSLVTSYTVLVSKKTLNNLVWFTGLMVAINYILIKELIISDFSFYKNIFLFSPAVCLLGTIIFSCTDRVEGLRKAINLYTLGFLLILINFFGHKFDVSYDNLRIFHYAAIAISIIVLALFSKYSRTQKIIIASIIFCYFCINEPASLWENTLVKYLFQILVMSLVAILMALQNRQRLFNIVLVFIALKIISTYLTLIGSLLVTGIGLIGSGVLILGFAFLIHKKQDHLLEIIRRLDHA